jgi:hypothetical protein
MSFKVRRVQRVSVVLNCECGRRIFLVWRKTIIEIRLRETRRRFVPLRCKLFRVMEEEALLFVAARSRESRCFSVTICNVQLL